MFNITKAGNRVDIFSSGIDFRITGSLVSGTSMMVANIEAVGYDWEVTASGLTGTAAYFANIKLKIGGELMSGGCWGMNSGYRKMLYAPWTIKQTMGNTGVTGSLTPTLLYSIDKNEYLNTQIEMTSERVFLLTKNSSTEDIVLRFSISGSSSQIYSPEIGLDHFLYNFAPYNNDVVYTLEEDYDSIGHTYDNFQIREVTFNGATGTSSSNLIYDWIYQYDTYGSSTYYFYYTYWFGRHKYGTNDCIVCIQVYHIDTGSDPTYMLKFIIYHIESGITSEQWVAPSNDADADLNSVSSASTSPSFYASKIIFTLTVARPGGVTPPYGVHCFTPTFITDISVNSVTRIETPTWDLDVDWPTLTTYECCSTIDYSTQKYYFTAWYRPSSGIGAGYYLFSMGINYVTPIVVQGDLVDYQESFQAYTKGYSVDRTPAPGACDVQDVPVQNVVNSVDILVEHGADYFESACAIDIPEDMIWNITSNTLQGKALTITATDRDIPIAWAAPGTVPFLYSSTQEVYLRILNGVCVIMVFSRRASPLAYQMDFYLLKE